jgi:hypothetical protein
MCPSQLIARYYIKFTGMTADEIERATNRDTFMTPEEAQQVWAFALLVGGQAHRGVSARAGAPGPQAARGRGGHADIASRSVG